MKFLFFSLLSLFSLNLLSQTNQVMKKTLNLEEFCSGPVVFVDETMLGIKDLGFCSALKQMKAEQTVIDKNFVKDIKHSLNLVENINLNSHIVGCVGEEILPNSFSSSPLQSSLNVERDDKWKIRFYASHSFTTYFTTDMKMRTSRFNIDIKDYQWSERSSREFFLPETWKKEGNNPFQWIDEPTNTFTLSIEKNKHEFFLTAFHPKFLQHDQTKFVTGTVDGTEVNGLMELNKPFDGYNQEPGELELVVNQNTHRQMMFEVGYGHRFKLIENKKIGNLTFVPSLALGISTGRNHSAVVREGEWWEFDGYTEKDKIQGIGGSLTNRVEYSIPSERFGLFYELRLSGYKQNHGFLDGTQEYDLKLMGNNVGITFMLYKNKKKPRNLPGDNR